MPGRPVSCVAHGRQAVSAAHGRQAVSFWVERCWAVQVQRPVSHTEVLRNATRGHRCHSVTHMGNSAVLIEKAARLAQPGPALIIAILSPIEASPARTSPAMAQPRQAKLLSYEIRYTVFLLSAAVGFLAFVHPRHWQIHRATCLWRSLGRALEPHPQPFLSKHRPRPASSVQSQTMAGRAATQDGMSSESHTEAEPLERPSSSWEALTVAVAPPAEQLPKGKPPPLVPAPPKTAPPKRLLDGTVSTAPPAKRRLVSPSRPPQQELAPPPGRQQEASWRRRPQESTTTTLAIAAGHQEPPSQSRVAQVQHSRSWGAPVQRYDGYRCANPGCGYLVNSDPVFGTYCCQGCHWRQWTGSKTFITHGWKCSRVAAPIDAPRAPSVPPLDPLGGLSEAS